MQGMEYLSQYREESSITALYSTFLWQVPFYFTGIFTRYFIRWPHFLSFPVVIWITTLGGMCLCLFGFLRKEKKATWKKFLIFYLIFYLLKRSGRSQYRDNELFRVLSSMPINGNRSLHLVEVGEQYFLIGSAENSVSLISEIQDKETIDGIRLKLSNLNTEDKSSFKDILSNIFKPTGGQGYRSSFTDSLDFMKNQRNRLKRF